MTFFLVFLVLISTAWVTENSQGQTASVSGVIIDRSSSQLLEGANIVLENKHRESSQGASADRNGFYQISVEPGTYIMKVSYIGYITHLDTLHIDDTSARINVALEPNAQQLDDLVVSNTGGAVRQSVGTRRVSAVDLQRIPTPAGGGDLASYLQTLPGVVSTGDRGGQLFIRGGTPSENMVLVDGSLIYQPFHIVGFFSAFPEELISGADFHAGGFGPRYTGRASSVIDVQMRDGNLNKYRGSGSMSPFLGELLIEGPLKKGSLSWIASARQSMIEETSPLLLGERQPLQFNSQFFKLSHVKDNLRCSTTAMRTSDQGRLDYGGEEVIRWSNFVLGGRCAALPDGTSSFMDIHAGLSRLSNSLGGSAIQDLSSNTTRFNMDVNVTQFAGGARFDFGVFSQMKFLNYNMRELFWTPVDYDVELQSNEDVIFGVGAHFETTIPLGSGVTIQPGTAFSFYPEIYKPSLEPRLRATWQPWGSEDDQLSAALGVYRQMLTGFSDIRDAASVFTAWLPAPADSRMRAIHILLGWGQNLGGGFDWSVEGYYKRLKDKPIPQWDPFPRFSTSIAAADGNVYGGDVQLEYNRAPFYGFIGYGYSWMEYETSHPSFQYWFGNPTQSYHPPHDRRHQFTAQFSTGFGEYTTSLGWQFATGFPFTNPGGFDYLIRFNDYLPDVRNEPGIPRSLIEKPYGERLPVYHRLDVSVKRGVDLPVGRMIFQAGAINLYDRVNLFYYDSYTKRRLDQLPIAPYFSLKIETR